MNGWRGQRLVLALVPMLGAVRAAAADPEVSRRPDTTWRRLMRGPYHSSRLFSTPVADTVGPYVLALSYDGSLLREPGVLSSAGVLAIGFGDLAQLEYRHTSAISLDEVSAPLPAVGLQLALPLPRTGSWPAVALAFRLGVPRRELHDALTVDEAVTDLYLVVRQRLPGRLAPITIQPAAAAAAARWPCGRRRARAPPS